MKKTKQKQSSLFGPRQWLIVAGLMVVLFVFAFGVYGADWLFKNSTKKSTDSSQIVTVEGTVVCLPHKDTTGPQTDECAIGLKVNSGKYYGVADQDITSSMGTNKTIKVSGVLEEPTSTNKYDIVGIIRAQ